jgi:hypothetical protein
MSSSKTKVQYVYVYPAVTCFLEGTKILCQIENKEQYIPVENLRPGCLVKTLLNGYKKVELIGKGPINNPGNTDRIQTRLYKCSRKNYPELNDDLFITGCHSILVETLTSKQIEETKKVLGDIYVTDNKYRLMSYLDDRAEAWNSEGTYTIWHFALENDNNFMNYGVYANGLLVETSSKRYINNLSNLTLVK